MTEETYTAQHAKMWRIEFSEQQQWMRSERMNSLREPDTNGFITVAVDCSDVQRRTFEAFYNRIKVKPLTNDYMRKSWTEFESFMKNLDEYGLSIDYHGEPQKQTSDEEN